MKTVINAVADLVTWGSVFDYLFWNEKEGWFYSTPEQSAPQRAVCSREQFEVEKRRQNPLFQWISWHQPTEDHRPLTYPPNKAIMGWWCSGYSGRDAIICALVDASDEPTAQAAVLKDWPEAERWRFCEARDNTNLGDRFPLKAWMLERMPATPAKPAIAEPIKVVCRFRSGTYITNKVNGKQASNTAGADGAVSALGRKLLPDQEFAVTNVDGDNWLIIPQ
jgi:hypothetical protein